MATSSTTTTSSSSSLPLQTISGLASGIDTASVVSALMGVAKLPEVAIQNRITVEQARQNAYSSVLKELNALTTSYQAVTDVTAWAPVQSATSSDATAVGATITGGAAAGAYTIAATQLARANQFTAGGATSAAADDVLHIATSAGTTDVKIAAGDSLAVIAGKINQTTGTPVYATIFNGNLVLSNTQTGSAKAITNVTTDGGSGLTFTETQTAQDAKLTVNNGGVITSGSNTVTNAIAGVTLNLGATTTGTTITIGAPAANTSDIQSKLQAFITQYNTVLTDIQARLTDAPIANPKTDEDRARGVLYGDQGLQRLLSNLRNSFADPMKNGGSYTALSQVGLSTGAAVGHGELSADAIAGKLTLDTTKFQNALATNFSAVKALFTNATGSYSTEGLGQRLTDILRPYTRPKELGGSLPSKIANEQTTIDDLKSQVADWDQRLALKQQMYARQFTQMETALSQSQAIAGQLAGQIAKLGG